MSEVKLHPDWLARIGGEFEQPYMAALKAFLGAEREKGKHNSKECQDNPLAKCCE